MKAKNTQPYIDYKTARTLAFVFDFINRSNQMRVDMVEQLKSMRYNLAIMQNEIS